MEEISWYQLPLDLQAQFYKRAEEDSDKILNSLKEVSKKLTRLKSDLKIEFNQFNFSDKELKIGAVDGSKSMSMSNRLGLKIAVLSCCSLILKGNERIENFRVGSIKERQTYSDESSIKRLGLLLSYIERKSALEILNEVDYLIVDGSFYGFIYPILRLKKEGALSEEMKKLLNEVYYLTNKLIDSKKVIAVVKRSRTRVIGALMFLKYKDASYVDLLDRLILTYILPEQSIFDYATVAKMHDENFVQIYNQISSLILKRQVNEELIERAKDKAYEPVRSLGLSEEHVKKLTRIKVKSYTDTATCEIEHPKLDIKELTQIVSSKNFFNPATGLPLILDMVDSLTSLPSNFTEDYALEVQARAIYKAMKHNLPID